MASPLTTIARDLQDIRESWGDLLAARLHGTPRPLHETVLDAARRAELDELARAERLEAAPDAPGRTPAPLHLDISQVIADATTSLVELEAAARERLGFNPTPRAPAVPTTLYQYDDHRQLVDDEQPDGTVHWICVWLEDALAAIADVPELAKHTAAEAGRIAAAVRTAAGYADRCILLKTPCFVCGGRSDANPDGALTLRLYTATRVVDAYVLCHNPACQPDTAACGSFLRGRPMWTSGELDWLNTRLDQANVA